jgi:hypothetical protein
MVRRNRGEARFVRGSSRLGARLSVLFAVLLVMALFPAQVASPAQGATPSPPFVSTGAATNVTYSSAILHGQVNARGVSTTFVFQYGTNGAYGVQTPLAPAGNGTQTINVSQAVSGLKPGTTYHYRVVAVSGAGSTKGADRTFKTASIPLTLSIVGVPNPVVFGGSFVVEGNLSGTGSPNREIVLQANPFPYVAGFRAVGNPELSNAAGGFSFPFVGLTQNTQLRVATVATVGKPTVYSPVVIEYVAVRITFHVRRTRRHGFARLYGTVTPAEPGALVGFQLLTPGAHSVNRGGTVVKSATSTHSRFSRVVHIRKRGLYRALVKVNDGAHASNYSAPVLIR